MPKRNLIWVAITIGIAALAVWLAPRDAPLDTPRRKDVVPLQPLIRLHVLAREHYHEEVPTDVLAGAIDGYLRKLDPYCRYLPPDRPKLLGRIIHGRRCDLGIHFAIEGSAGARKVRILGLRRGSPGFRAGLQPGDVVNAIDGQPIPADSMRLQIAARLDGKDGKTTKLTILRASEKKPREVEVECEAYPVETVTGLYRGPDGQWVGTLDEGGRIIAYVRINEFVSRSSNNPGTGVAFEEMLGPLVHEGIDGLVLDLRNNPGGPLLEAVDVADRFLSSSDGDGMIVLTQGRTADDERHMAHDERTLPPMPVVVLVNAHTASAAEVVAGALKKHRRALLVGTPTHGKDTIQTPFRLGKKMGQVTLTTKRYHFVEPIESVDIPEKGDSGATPSVKRLRKPRRIEPDSLLSHDEETDETLARLRYRMEVMPVPAPRWDAGATTRPPDTAPVGKTDLTKWLETDRQLARALQLLRKPKLIEGLLKIDE